MPLDFLADFVLKLRVPDIARAEVKSQAPAGNGAVALAGCSQPCSCSRENEQQDHT